VVRPFQPLSAISSRLLQDRPTTPGWGRNPRGRVDEDIELKASAATLSRLEWLKNTRDMNQ
jgi:hypothetical protein